MSNQPKPPHAEPPPKKMASALLNVAGLIFLVLCILGAMYFVKNKPVAQKKRPPRMMPVVEVVDLVAEDTRITMQTLGSVIPAREIEIKAQITGEIFSLNESFIEGGIISKGDPLLTIDDSDYQLAILRKQALVEKMRSDLKMEQGQQEIAEREWEIMGPDESGNALDKELALRKPQLNKLKASLKSDEAELEQARTDLKRTKIISPFNSVVRNKHVDLGDLASPQQSLATLTGTDAFWVQISIPLDELQWVVLPKQNGAEGSMARITDSSDQEWPAKVIRLLSDLEPNGRMARLLVEVEDPLALNDRSNEKTPLLLGDVVRVSIEGKQVNQVYKIPVNSLRDGSNVWLLSKEETLKVIPIEKIWANKEFAFIKNGFEADDQLIVSGLGGPMPGMQLRLAGQSGEAAPDAKPPAPFAPAE